VLTREDSAHHLVDLGGLIMLVQGDETTGRPDPPSTQKAPGVAGVLTENDVSFGQDLFRARAEVT
jgi:hypothetical protein